MLRRMFVGEPVGDYDRILDVSTAVTGTTFFVPSNPVLASLAAAGSDAAADDAGSLGIGSLRPDLSEGTRS